MEKQRILPLWGKMISDTIAIGFLELRSLNVNLIMMLSAILGAVFLAGVAWLCIVFSVALFFFHQGEPLPIICMSLAIFHLLISAAFFTFVCMRNKYLTFPTTRAAIQTLLGNEGE